MTRNCALISALSPFNQLSISYPSMSTFAGTPCRLYYHLFQSFFFELTQPIFRFPRICCSKFHKVSWRIVAILSKSFIRNNSTSTSNEHAAGHKTLWKNSKASTGWRNPLKSLIFPRKQRLNNSKDGRDESRFLTNAANRQSPSHVTATLLSCYH